MTASKVPGHYLAGTGLVMQFAPFLFIANAYNLHKILRLLKWSFLKLKSVGRVVGGRTKSGLVTKIKCIQKVLQWIHVSNTMWYGVKLNIYFKGFVNNIQ